MKDIDINSEVKKIRNKIKKFNGRGLLYICINILHKTSMQPIEKRKYIPCYVLFLTKLIFEHGDYFGRKREATYDEFNKFYNLIVDLYSASPFLKENNSSGLRKFLRVTAFQQFWLQNDYVNTKSFGRPIMIFGYKGNSFDYDFHFEEITGVSIKQFFELSFATIAGIAKKDGDFRNTHTRVKISIYDNLKPTFSESTIKSFVNAISGDYGTIQSYLKKDGSKIRIYALQILEQTPLKRYPFYKDGDSIYALYLPMFYSVLEEYVYDILKHNYGSQFSESFGISFQKYIEKGIEYSGNKYLNEKNLEDIFPRCKKADFLITNDKCTVIVESKGIEMSEIAKVYPTDQIMKSAFKDDITKALKQIYSTVKLVKANPEKAKANDSLFFALIITYKDLYISNGKEAFEEFASEELNKYLIANDIDTTVLPLENIFFLSIDDFDELMLAIKVGGDQSIDRIINKVIQNNLNPATQKYTFSQHLDGLQKQDQVLPEVEKAAEKIFNKLEAIFRN